MDLVQTDRKLSVKLERSEMRYWSDYYLSASKNLRRKLGMDSGIIKGAFCGSMRNVDTLAFNRVTGLGLDYEIDEETIQSIIGFYKKSKVQRFFIQLSPAARPDFASQILEASGFEYYNNWVKFYKKIMTPLPEVESELVIKPVEYAQAEIFDYIIRKAFDWKDDAARLTSQTLGRPGWRHYFAVSGSKPVAAAAMFINGNVASLAISGTLPEYRGLGAQTALITRRINDAYRAECKYMVVETAEDKPDKSSASNRNMKRFGFREAYLRPNYIYYTNMDKEKTAK